MPKALIIKVSNPDPRLVHLLEEGADGGFGEFEEFLPEECRAIWIDAVWVPELEMDNSVTWIVQSPHSLSRQRREPSRMKLNELVKQIIAGGKRMRSRRIE